MLCVLAFKFSMWVRSVLVMLRVLRMSVSLCGGFLEPVKWVDRSF